MLFQVVSELKDRFEPKEYRQILFACNEVALKTKHTKVGAMNINGIEGIGFYEKKSSRNPTRAVLIGMNPQEFTRTPPCSGF